MLHFAYGSNMSRAVMRKHAPDAEPLGTAALTNYRFIITTDRYASVEPMRAETVHGVLWRLTPRDHAILDAWENVASGLYRAETLPVHQAGRRRLALTYIARPRGMGRARSGYMELVVAAAREWKLPSAYISVLQEWLPTQPRDARARKLGEFGWM